MMITNKRKVLATVVAALLLTGAQFTLAQMTPPSGGGTPPAGGGTPPAGGGTPPAGGGTPPAGGGTPPAGGGTPPTGGGTPPTGGTTPPTGACILPTPGITIPVGATVCNFSFPGSGSAGSDSSTFFKNVSLDQIAGMSADQLGKFDPKAASGFSADQIAALLPAALSGMGADMIKNLSPTAMSGMKDSQIAALSPTAMQGLTPDLIKNLSPDSMDGFKPQQISQMLPSQLASFTPSQFTKMDPAAMGGVTPDQFKSLPTNLLASFDTSKLAALDVNVIKSMEKDSLAKLDVQAFKKLDPKEMSEMLVNFDKQKIAPADIKNILPADWSVNDTTGKLQPPAGGQLVLKTLANTGLPVGVEMPKLPDLGSGMAIGGDNFTGSVLDGMKKALENAGLPGFDMIQTKGVLNVVGTGAQSGTKLAFIPDSEKIVQAAVGTASGLSKNAEGKYVLTTADGMQVPVIPALSSPENLLKAAPGTKVAVDANGGTRITPANGTPLMGIPDPTVIKSTLTPGIHHQGTGATEQLVIVYGDGTAQNLKPTIQDPDEFRQAAKAFTQIRDIKIGMDGIITVDFGGQLLKLRPDFDVTPASGGSGGSVTPTITSGAGGTFKFTNSHGDSQEFYLGG